MFQSYLIPSILTILLTYSWFSFYGVRYFQEFKLFNEEKKVKGKPTVHVPVYMWEIFNNRINSSNVDVIKGVYPTYLSASFKSRPYMNHRLREIRFSVPDPEENEILLKAEIRIATHEIRNPTHFQVYLKTDRWIFLDEKKISDNNTDWVSVEVLLKNETVDSGFITVIILTLFGNLNKCIYNDFLQPILFLSYYNKNDFHVAESRQKRNAQLEEYEEKTNRIWKHNTSNRPQKLKNSCRIKPLYIKFSDINYDSWIVAPSGYEAFQCVGKCTFPVSEHLSPTKHAILQTLLHHVFPSKVARACCVPTKLDPISILYIDANGVLTYRLRYRDMVVKECGCR